LSYRPKSCYHSSDNKQGWPLKLNRKHSDSWRREASSQQIKEYRVKSGDRGHSRKQRELTATYNSHREQLGYRAGQRSFLDHVEDNHMFGGKDAKSFFKTTKLCDIWSLVNRTLTCPDEQREDKSNKDRLVVKKRFRTPIGVHGFGQANCYTVKVVCDQLKLRPITAYPIQP